MVLLGCKLTPHDYTSRGNPGLPEADLAVCAAEDNGIRNEDTQAKTFNAACYIGLEPTDWYQGSDLTPLQ